MVERILGEELKAIVNAKGGISLDECEWHIEVWCSSYKVVTIRQDECIALGGGEYAFRIDTTELGIGTPKIKVVAEVADGDYEDDGKRTTIGGCPMLDNDGKQVKIVRYGRA